MVNATGVLLHTNLGRAPLAVSTDATYTNLELDLSGPTPWNAKGKASFKILFVKVKVRFDKTWGEERDTTLPDVEVLPRLTEALAARDNWRAELPARSRLLVSLKEIGDVDAEHVIAHPAGVLTVRQKVVPLDTAIDRFGSQKPADANRFSIDRVRADGSELPTRTVDEFFAPAQFEDLSDAQKLSRKSFERLPAGVEVTSADTQIRSSRVVARAVRYETVIIDTRLRIVRLLQFFSDRFGLFFSLLRGTASARSRLSPVAGAEPVLGPGRIGVAEEGFTVVGIGDLRPVDARSGFTSETGAQGYLRRLTRDDPGLRGKIQVVPDYEVNEAA